MGGLARPSSGIAHFADHDHTAANESQLTQYRREHVGCVFQFYNLIPSLSVRENVALVTDIADSPMPAEEALGLVGLAERILYLGDGRIQRVEQTTNKRLPSELSW